MPKRFHYRFVVVFGLLAASVIQYGIPPRAAAAQPAPTRGDAAPRADAGRSSVRPWVGGAIALGRVGRRCPTCAYERSPFTGVVVSLGAGVAVAQRWRVGLEANQWFEAGLTERADKRSLFATATAAYAPAGLGGASFKLGTGVARHGEGNPDVSARGAVLQVGLGYRFRRRGLSPSAVLDYMHPLGGTRRAGRVDAAGPYEASLLKVGVGVDWRGQ